MSYSLFSGLQQTLHCPPTNKKEFSEIVHRDFRIQFHAARGLPKMDVVGTADPYFCAKIDDGQIVFHSSCIVNTRNPVWNEDWIVRNVPSTAMLSVTIYDKDDDTVHDDYIGKFTIDLQPVENEYIPIVGPSNKHRGTFQLSIELIPATPGSSRLRPYTFDGPVRFSRHTSSVAGLLTKVNDEGLYSTWKIHLRRIDFYFDREQKQKWNSSYHAAKAIFQGPMAHAIQSAIKQAHRALYAKRTTSEFGILHSLEDFWSLLIDTNTNYVKPCVYTYIIEDHTWRFSETSASFFMDCASKHAMHANCAQTVHYAGEFHPRPKCGWNQYDPNETLEWDQWELVIDNGSGTYAPDLALLGTLRELLAVNFPDLNVVTYNFEDPALKESIKACRNFAKSPKAQRSRTLKHLVPSPLLP